jgi:hypothetical protein
LEGFAMQNSNNPALIVRCSFVMIMLAPEKTGSLQARKVSASRLSAVFKHFTKCNSCATKSISTCHDRLAKELFPQAYFSQLLVMQKQKKKRTTLSSQTSYPC